MTGEPDLALKSRGCSSTRSVSDSSLLTDDDDSALRAAGRNHCGTTSVGRGKRSNDFWKGKLFIAATAAIDAAATVEATVSKLDIEFNLVFGKYNECGMLSLCDEDLRKFKLFPLSARSSSLSSVSYELSLE